MAVLRHFSKKLLLNNVKLDVGAQINNNIWTCLRMLSYSAIPYDGNPDPRPVFIKKEVQSLLKTLTRVDLAKVYAKRKLGEKLEQPVYKFMTDEELQQAFDEVKKKVDEIIQMPPVVPVRKPIDRVLSRDPGLQGFDTSPFVFTDITYGIRDSERIILVRDTDGNLKEADWDLRNRMNQIYFPMPGRSVKMPRMFQDHFLEDLLKRQEYNFILDRACLQFEPNDPVYQKVVSVTYQHVSDNNKFDDLRSTRHFGTLAFFLAWHKMIDNLLLDVIESEHIDEAHALVKLHSQIHQVKFESDDSFQAVEEYIKKISTKKGALELALQAYRNATKERAELEAGIKRAHGLN
ncbi:hypothetical protein MTP99_010405 [Tenebrio molitor]|jgi:small subunit ribosomal protein S22|uniref:28S ribosomal protein S22, mitochondrial n=1 Tax=Tenebrio molitor TaxID=7067 RepID=A0A8J6LFY7_TENMO|nr:hypothetical protein GEV33_004923 [Tenebrio molitor]KAJ3633455.1 hypothetical protein MTP99_010405 [Tenebrio molitor]